MTKPKLNALDVLTAMSEAQHQQFMQATTLVIGMVMKQLNLTELTIGPDDVQKLSASDKLTISVNPNGGFVYKLNSHEVH